MTVVEAAVVVSMVVQVLVKTPERTDLQAREREEQAQVRGLADGLYGE